MGFSRNVGYLVGRALHKCASLLGADKKRQPCPACGSALGFRGPRAFAPDEPFCCSSCKQWPRVSRVWSRKLRVIQLVIRFGIAIALLLLLFRSHLVLFFILTIVLTFGSIIVTHVVAIALFPPSLEPYLGLYKRSLFDARSWP